VVFLTAVLGVFFEVANQAFLPSLVGPENVAEGNAKMQVSMSSAQVAGPSVAGALIAAVSAAMVILIDAISYFVGAVASALIRKPEPRPGGESGHPKVFAAIGAGLRWIWTQPLFRPMVFATAFYMTFLTGIQALYVFYAQRTLHLSSQYIGLTLAFLGIGAIVGSMLSLKTLRRVGPGPAAFWSTVVGNGAVLLIPLAGGPTWLVVVLLSVSQALVGLTTPIAQVGMGSLRMVLTPNEMQGRVVATFRGLSLGLAPVGALAAGFLGGDDVLGLHPTMWIFAIGVLIPIFVILFSPIPGTREFPKPAAAG
jgi:predicted MFS family arabinose efflux permease